MHVIYSGTVLDHLDPKSWYVAQAGTPWEPTGQYATSQDAYRAAWGREGDNGQVVMLVPVVPPVEESTHAFSDQPRGRSRKDWGRLPGEWQPCTGPSAK